MALKGCQGWPRSHSFLSEYNESCHVTSRNAIRIDENSTGHGLDETIRNVSVQYSTFIHSLARSLTYNPLPIPLPPTFPHLSHPSIHPSILSIPPFLPAPLPLLPSHPIHIFFHACSITFSSPPLPSPLTSNSTQPTEVCMYYTTGPYLSQHFKPQASQPASQPDRARRQTVLLRCSSASLPSFSLP